MDKALKYCFTAYLNAALKREKNDYIIRKVNHKILLNINSVEIEEIAGFGQDCDKIVQEEAKKQFGSGGWDIKELTGWFDVELEQALLALSEKERRILLLRVCQELPYNEIGTMLRLNARQVTSVYHYACKKMKRKLEGRYEV